MRDVFLTFLRLGSTSFGGPIAHLGYFRREFVERRQWIGEDEFAAIVAFCSVLPGPTSSQVGMLVGLIRGGGWGALLAWIGFTGPSAIAMTAFALALRALETHDVTRSGWFVGLLAGLTAAAAAVVAQAVLALARALCTDRETQTIGLGAAVLAIALSGIGTLQWVPIVLGALVGWLFLRGAAGTIAAGPLPIRVPRGVALASAAIFALVLAVLFVPFAAAAPAFTLLATILRAGSLVFGGGHVVLPLLQGLVGAGLISSRDFFAGYGVVQAMPGPLFTFGSFLGAANLSPLSGVPGALVATIAIFLPSFALIFALAPIWNRIRALPGAGAALRGANAAVVGLLGAVLYHPILTSLSGSSALIGIALTAFALVQVWKLAPWVVVVASAALGAVTGSAP